MHGTAWLAGIDTVKSFEPRIVEVMTSAYHPTHHYIGKSSAGCKGNIMKELYYYMRLINIMTINAHE
jgi:hypothetical protein